MFLTHLHGLTYSYKCLVKIKTNIMPVLHQRKLRPQRVKQLSLPKVLQPGFTAWAVCLQSSALYCPAHSLWPHFARYNILSCQDPCILTLDRCL